MASGPYDIGDKVRVSGTFKDVDDNLVDPSAVVIKFKAPDTTITTPAVSHPGTGIYYADQSITAPGKWFYRIESTGTGQAAAEGSFDVVVSNFP